LQILKTVAFVVSYIE